MIKRYGKLKHSRRCVGELANICEENLQKTKGKSRTIYSLLVHCVVKNKRIVNRNRCFISKYLK